MRLLIILGLLFLGLPALAANIVQKDKGETVWEDADGDQWPAGDSGLLLNIEDLATAATDFVVSGKAGRLASIRVVPHGAFDANSNAPALDFGIDTGNDGGFVAVAETLTVATGTAGVYSTLTLTTDYMINVGDVISIHGDGDATGTTVGTVTIIIE